MRELKCLVQFCSIGFDLPLLLKEGCVRESSGHLQSAFDTSMPSDVSKKENEKVMLLVV